LYDQGLSKIFNLPDIRHVSQKPFVEMIFWWSIDRIYL